MVNILDVHKFEESDEYRFPEEALKDIMDRQEMLCRKYVDIETKNGSYHPSHWPVDIDARQSQVAIKDWVWRFVEELSESLTSNSGEHKLEELSDALHFLTDINLFTGMRENVVSQWDHDILREHGDPVPLCPLTVLYRDYLRLLRDDRVIPSSLRSGQVLVSDWRLHEDLRVGMIVRHIGSACNCLKNKPWKSSHVLTDKARFNEHLMETWRWFLFHFFETGQEHSPIKQFGPEQVHQLYFGKHHVNKFRQRSNY